VGADLGHEEGLVPAALQGPAEPGLGPAVPVLPAVVEERGAGVDRLVNEPGGLVERGEVAVVGPAVAEDRHPLPGLTQPPPRDLPGAGLWIPRHRTPPRSGS